MCLLPLKVLISQSMLFHRCETMFFIFRIPESLSCLHDKVLAAAAEVWDNFYSSQNNHVILLYFLAIFQCSQKFYLGKSDFCFVSAVQECYFFRDF